MDGYTGATILGTAMSGGMDAVKSSFTWLDTFTGLVPGSFGETSTLACLLGTGILIASGIGPWRIILGMLLGGSLLYAIGSDTNPMFSMSPARGSRDHASEILTTGCFQLRSREEVTAVFLL